MKEFVDFKVVTLDGKTIIQHGYVDTTTLDDDEPLITFYDEQGLENNQPRNNTHPFDSEEFKVWEDTMFEWIADDMFFQFIHDFADENRTFKRDGYVLIINDRDNVDE